MLTKKQLAWVNHLSDTDKVEIIPFNPMVKDIFKLQKTKIRSILGKRARVLHRGASSMGISGKGDVDIYIPTQLKNFDKYLEKLTNALGQPKSLYPYERARWNDEHEGIEIEIFLMNETHPAWTVSTIFENYLTGNNLALEEYRIIKENAHGTSTREYYRIKLEFMNKIVRLAKKSL